MLHRIINRLRNVARKEDPAIVLENIPSDFRHYIDASRRDAALFASLDTDENGGDELGIQFAETVMI